ncbi:MAG: amino acid adenylation domain-containing protein, partial [Acidobacteria bacterium]|nr:amino acid adenylation domain-containing protein [Acidobacteriota bacterium]
MNKEPKSLTSTITGWSQHFPEKTAVKSEFPSVSVSYLELEAYTNRIANFLHGKVTGVPHVVILLDKSPGLIASIIGILKCGLVFITINPSLPPARIKIMVETTQAEWIITNEKYTKIVNDTGITGLKILLTDTLAHEPGLGQDYFYLEAGPGNDALTFDPIYNKECYIFFTSGSTGVPKAVLGRQKSLLHFLQWEIKEFNVNEHCRISQFTSPSFDPFLRDVFVPLLAGGTCCIPAQDTLMNMKQLIHWIAENKITLIHTVPSLFKQMLSEIESGDCFTHLENILLAGELLRGQDIAPFIRLFKQRIQLVNFCGPTETTLAKLFYRIQPGDENRSIIPVGKPIEGAEILILDNLMRKCPTGKKGEIYIRTPFRSAGYYNDPALTRQVFLQNPYSHHANDLIYKSGDLGRELPDGNIELLGRIDFQVKIRGFRIEVGEIENRLLTHPGIRDSVVTAVENENGEKYLCAYVVFSPGLQTAATELKKHLAAELPDYMIPSYFVKLEHLPLTATGKIDRTALPAPQPEVDVNYIVPADETEKKLVKIWSEILHKKENQISVEANFFELGGHSLKAAALAAKIHKEFNVNVPLSELFKITTIRELSRYIRRGEKECYLEITPCEKKFFYPLSPAQKRLYLLQAMAENSSAYNIPQMMKITGRLEVEKLRNAFNTLIQRHESLRTSFHMINDEPVQRIRDTVEFEIEYLAADACGVHGQTRPTNGENGNLLKFIKPFDLTQAPLLRVILVRLAEEEDILTVDMHHIISDGISITILIRDFLALYAGKELPEIKLQYKDYAQWLSRENKSKNILTQAEYWRQQFAGEIPLLALPTDFIRPDVQSFAGNRTSFEIDSQTLGTLQALALEAGATLYIVLLALYNIFLAKLSGQEDIVVGSPVAGRNHTDLERIIGIFVNTLAIRNFLLGEKIFSEFLLEVKQKVL